MVYDRENVKCPECGSDDIDHEENKDFGEYKSQCNVCGHILFYYCKADERD